MINGDLKAMVLHMPTFKTKSKLQLNVFQLVKLVLYTFLIQIIIKLIYLITLMPFCTKYIGLLKVVNY